MRGAILVTSTRPGVRPLGVRGEPLHNAQAQLRAVVRRRLGDRHFHLLAEPEPHALGGRIDWYCAVPGTVRPLADLPEAERDAARTDIDALLADIDRTGQSLEAGPTEDGRLAGKSLRLAARRPTDEYLFLVGDQPVVVCWGYDTQAAGAVLPSSFIPTQVSPAAARPAVPEPWAPPPAALPPPLSPSQVPAAVVAAAAFPWLFWLLAALFAILILMAASWVLRQIMPVEPDLRVTVLPAPPPPPPPEYDPLPDLRRELEAARDEEGKLRPTLASLRDELARRLAQCKPVEPDKPPDLPEDRWNKRDLAILDGCWQLGEPTPATLDNRDGSVKGRYTAGRLCFDGSGRGTYEITGEFPGHPTLHCKGPVTAVFQPDGKIRVHKPESTCGDGRTRWRITTYTCRRVSDNTAMCASPGGREDEFRREGP